MTVAGHCERIIAAIRTINELNDLGDGVYDVRERFGGDDVGGLPYTDSSWEHPKMKAYGDALAVLRDEGVIA
jgi:hypothetical protein